jgi:hypothetical protein
VPALALAALALAPAGARAWTVEEHRLLADSALARTCDGWPAHDAWTLRAVAGSGSTAGGGPLDTLGFGGISAWSAGDDRAMGRRHERDRTVLEQLRRLTAARLDSLARGAAAGDAALLGARGPRARARLARLELPNPVASFLQHHGVALRLARAAGEAGRAGPDRAPPPMLRRALVYEAIAQGYLADAFAAGHLMTPAGARPGGFDPLNLRHAHDHWSNLGAYVINGRGETWQTFGDRLLLWYGPSFAHVFEASVTSLRELLLVYHAARGGPMPAPLAAWGDSIAAARGTSRERLADAWCASHEGPGYLATVRLPTLTLIPTPVVATWSVRTEARDAHGLRRRHHYPQLAEPGGHDPSLDRADVARLPARAAVPEWMIPDTLFAADPVALVRAHPDFASARFAQATEPPPTYAGPLVFAGVAWNGERGGGEVGHGLGLGFGLVGESTVLVDRVSLDLVFMTPASGPGPRWTLVRAGASPSLPRFGIWRAWWARWVDRARFEVGRGWTRDGGVSADGDHFALALESPTLHVGFAYTGLTVRVGYQWTDLDRPRRGPAVGVVLQ